MLPDELQKLVREAGSYGSGLQGILLDAALRRLITAPTGAVLTVTNVRLANGKHALVIDYRDSDA